MIFAGIMSLYMISGVIYAAITNNPFESAIPFIFVIQGMVLSLGIAALWEIFLNDTLIKNWRFAKRCIAFKLALIPLLALCFFTFLAIPINWVLPWFIALVGISMGIVILAMVSEVYFKKTGIRYTQILQTYQKR